MVSPTVLSFTWESPYLQKMVFILRRGPDARLNTHIPSYQYRISLMNKTAMRPSCFLMRKYPYLERRSLYWNRLLFGIVGKNMIIAGDTFHTGSYELIIQISWKILFALSIILVIQSGRNFAHVGIFRMSWHVQSCDLQGGVLFVTQAWVLLKWKFTQVHI